MRSSSRDPVRVAARGLAALGLAAACAGCGDGLAAADYTGALGTLRGTISIPPEFPRGNVRVALLWLGPIGEEASRVEQAAASVRNTLSEFELTLTALPPPDLFRTDPRGASWVQGAIVAYDDVNDNGRLDVVAPPLQSPDRILGSSADVRVFFLIGEVPRADAAGDDASYPLRRGLSLRHFALIDPGPGTCAASPGSGSAPIALPCAPSYLDPRPIALPGNVTVTASGDPHLQGYACSSFWGSEPWPDSYAGWHERSPLSALLCSGPGCHCTGTGCPLDLPPPGAKVLCDRDQTAYVYKVCIDDPALCGTRICHYGHGERDRSAPLPAGWPC